jgi:hypothetical protein
MITINEIHVKAFTQDGKDGALAYAMIDGEEHALFAAQSDNQSIPRLFNILSLTFLNSLIDQGLISEETLPKEAKDELDNFRNEVREGRVDL